MNYLCRKCDSLEYAIKIYCKLHRQVYQMCWKCCGHTRENWCRSAWSSKHRLSYSPKQLHIIFKHFVGALIHNKLTLMAIQCLLKTCCYRYSSRNRHWFCTFLSYFLSNIISILYHSSTINRATLINAINQIHMLTSTSITLKVHTIACNHHCLLNWGIVYNFHCKSLDTITWLCSLWNLMTTLLGVWR